MVTEFEWAKYIVDKLREKGHKTFLVGGCVRDMIMDITPSDYDVVTNASLDEIKTIFSRTINVGASFGVLLLVKDKKICQVSTFRDNAKTPFEDAQKRDFTINGLYYDHVNKTFFDWVNGTADIRKKIVRAIGCAKSRFKEDPIRLIRAVRFASTLKFSIENQTYRAIKEMTESILSSSPERIREEIIKIFNHKNSDKGFSILIECGLFEKIFPAIFKIYEKNPHLIEFTGQMLNAIEEPNYLLGLSALLCVMGFINYNTNNIDKKINSIKKILNHYKFSNNEIKSIAAILTRHLIFIKICSFSDGRKKKFMQSGTFLLELEFHKIHLKTLKKDLKSYTDLKLFYQTLRKKEIFPDPLITGKDLIKQGFTPNSSWGNLFDELELMQLDNTIKNKE
ncbi:CCA tRNA nucleotidyltransferase, partial [bacterium]|nr:CCA tRNA nucleotidyltransferase [bacterium]